MGTPYKEVGEELRQVVSPDTDEETGRSAISAMRGIVEMVLAVLLSSDALRKLIDARVNELADARVAQYLDANPPQVEVVHVYVPHTHEARTVRQTTSMPVYGHRWWLFVIGGALGFLLGVVLNVLINASPVDTTTVSSLTHFWATAVDGWGFKIVTTAVLTVFGALAIGSIRTVVSYEEYLDDVHVHVHENNGLGR